MPEIFAAVVSVAPTKRRRWLWAAWWTAPPAREPFRHPDASEGGAETREAALAAAAAAAGRPLVEIEGRWARAYARTLLGQPPWTARERAAASSGVDAPLPRRPAAPAQASIWQLLGVQPRATTEEIRRAFRARALSLHPDHGGDADAFRALRAAYDEALRRRQRDERRPRGRR